MSGHDINLQRIKHLINQGVSIPTIARQHQISESSVMRRITGDWSPEELRESNKMRAQHMHLNGMRDDDIAKRLGISTSEVTQAIRALGKSRKNPYATSTRKRRAQKPRQRARRNPRRLSSEDRETFRIFDEDTSYTSQDLADLFGRSISWVSQMRTQLKVEDGLNEGLSEEEIAKRYELRPDTVAKMAVIIRPTRKLTHRTAEEIAEALKEMTGFNDGAQQLEFSQELLEDYLGQRLYEKEYAAGEILFLDEMLTVSREQQAAKVELAKKAEIARKAKQKRAEKLAAIEVPDLDLGVIRQMKVEFGWEQPYIAQNLDVSVDELKAFLKARGYTSIRDLAKEALPSFDEVMYLIEDRGLTQQQAAAQLSISPAKVSQILKAGGVSSVREIASTAGRAPKGLSLRKIAQLREKGKSGAEVAKALGVSAPTLSKFLSGQNKTLRAVDRGGFKTTVGMIPLARVEEAHAQHPTLDGGARALGLGQDIYAVREMYKWLELPIPSESGLSTRSNPRNDLLVRGGAFGVAGGLAVGIAKYINVKHPDMSVVKRSLISGGVPAGVSLGVYAKTKDEAALWGAAGSLVGTALSAYLFKK
jgi:predicted transcriptional regulator